MGLHVHGRRRVVYLGHPVAPTDAEVEEAAAMIRALDYHRTPSELRQLARRANVVRAQEILMALRREFRETTFIAPWIACLLGDGDGDGDGDDDDDPAQREAGLVDGEEVVRRSDAIALTGARLSPGLDREDHAGRKRDGVFTTYDLIGVITLATDVPTANRSLARWPSAAGGELVTFDAWASGAGRVLRFVRGAPPSGGAAVRGGPAVDPTALPSGGAAVRGGPAVARKEWNPEDPEPGESSEYVDGWNDALDAVARE